MIQRVLSISREFPIQSQGILIPIFGTFRLQHTNVGENFNSYVDRCRIERSKELLKNEKWKAYEVAAQVGYRNVDYFHKKFHKYVGMTPLQYRRQQTTGELTSQ
jgi:AraC-like DNA-binding protein